MLPTTLLVGLLAVARAQANLEKRVDYCKGYGRCCQCHQYGHYDNDQTNCVYYAIGAENWGDNGSGVFFCGLSKDQGYIARMCRGQGNTCQQDGSNGFGYDCWDC